MGIQREFLGWQVPPLQSAARYLFDRYRSDRFVDLRQVVVALPGARAGRRLIEILVNEAETQSVTLFLPRIITVGQLPEELYVAKRPLANHFTQHLAWMQALEATKPNQLRHLMRQRPESKDFAAWLSLAELVAALHRELAADGLSFASVVEQAASLAQFSKAESRRWHVLHDIQRRYLTILDGLELWDRQTARLYAIEHGECETDVTIVLAGTVDMNGALRQMVEQVAEQVTALVFAPNRLEDAFDDYGCVRPDRWQAESVSVPEEKIRIVDAPRDQANTVVNRLAEFHGRYAAEEIVIGVPDERLVPYIKQRLQESGVPARYGVSEQLADTGPVRLLRAIADFLATRSLAAFAALLRHPALGDWLRTQGIDANVLAALDRFYEQRLPGTLTDDWAEQGNANEELIHAQLSIHTLLTPLPGAERVISDWAAAVDAILVAVYGSRPLDPESTTDRKTLVACERIHEVANEFSETPASLLPRTSAAETLQLIIRLLDAEVIPAEATEPAVELLGWLELPLDDAPAVVVTGFNEGIVPSSRNSDLFLPNGLRVHLQIEDNRRRFARDAYALNLLMACRPDVTLIAGRRTADNDVLLPSRLLFPLDESLPERTLHLIQSDNVETWPLRLSGGLRAGSSTHQFRVPRLPKLAEPVTSMAVTEFRDYLACPYRYFLRRRLRLEKPNDSAEEMSAADFGNLLHQVLEAFGRNPVKDSQSVEEIRMFVERTLERLARRKYGPHPLAAVALQIEQARQRLQAFARWQAEWRSKGWRIVFAEQRIADHEAPFPVDGTPMYLHGTIDRIDQHDDGRSLILDYKTGESGNTPEKQHQKSGEWVDLQLPLYRHLAKGLSLNEPVELGYVVLPKNTDETGEHLAHWNEAALADADGVAADVIRRVRNEDFGTEPVKPPPPFFDEFAAICQDRQIAPSVAEDTEGEPS